MEKFKSLLNSNRILIFSRDYCPYCTAAKNLIKSLKYEYKEINFDTEPEGYQMEEYISQTYKHHTVPKIFINGEFVGGCDDLKALHSKKKLVPMIEG